MNHRVKGRKFKRTHSQRKALLKHLAEAFILQDRIETTTAKAKELSGFVEKLVTCAKRGDLSAAKAVHDTLAPDAAKRLLLEVAPKYAERNGGYTRIVKIGERKGDAAQMAIIEFV